MARDEILVHANGNASYVGRLASRVAYKRMWPTGETGSEWLRRLLTNPNYKHDEEHPFWYAEKDGMACLTPALLTEDNPVGDVTIIFDEEVSQCIWSSESK